MPWYYAGPEGKPVGPVSLEELQARRASGILSPDSYVIEPDGPSNEPKAWRRYREVFPASPVLPPLPAPASPAALPPSPVIAPHPLFPSATASHVRPSLLPTMGQAVHPGPVGTTNGWCAWGFWLGLASLFLLLPTCGLTSLLALAAFFISIAGLTQVHRHSGQSGRGLAVGGLLLSGLALLLTLLFLSVLIPLAVKQHEQTTTEQSTNDSE